MHAMTRLIHGAAVAMAGIALTAVPFATRALASTDQLGPGVFVQTNDPAGNSIEAYRRNADGTLSLSATYATGGSGGREIGAPSDPVASQGSLVYDQTHALLLAVNAGSNTVSVFGVQGDRLQLNQVIASGGSFPVSIDVHDRIAYVLNAGFAGTVSGFTISGGALQPIPGSTRTLGLPNSSPPFFLSSPAQVGFTPDGRQLIVTTKTNSTVDIFSVGQEGQLSPAPVKNPNAPVPFPFTFGPDNLLTLVTAGNSAVATYRIDDAGTITLVGAPVSDGQAAACWITAAKGFEYVANTASGSISQFRVGGGGSVRLINPVVASVPGAIDMTAADGGRLLYAESGTTGSIHAFAINPDGSLAPIQTVAIPDGANMEGIAAD